MSSKMILDNILFKNNPANFIENIHVEITFTALQPLPSLLEWKVIYVGSAKNEQYDQILQEFQIGPIEEASTMKFTLDCSPPDYTKIPIDQLICVTALIFTISYKGQEFIRVGYYVHNVLIESFEESERSQASIQTLINNTKRTILTDKPRITKFRINWGDQTMKEETNNQIKSEIGYSSNSEGVNSLRSERYQQKLSTGDEKQQNSQGVISQESQLIDLSPNSHRIEEQMKIQH